MSNKKKNKELWKTMALERCNDLKQLCYYLHYNTEKRPKIVDQACKKYISNELEGVEYIIKEHL